MGALDQLESFLQDLLERPAWLLTPHRFQPLRLASAISREMDERAVRLVDRIIVPSTYAVSLPTEDFAQVQSMLTTLERELAAYVERLAAERDLSLPSDPTVSIRQDSTLRPGRVVVSGILAGNRRHESPLASLRRFADTDRGSDAAGQERGLTLLGPEGQMLQRFLLHRLPMTIGRRSDNDVSLPDLKVSRHHARLESIGDEWYLTDLNSTNGTRINGEEVAGRNALHSGDIIEVGLQRFRFGA